MRSLPSQAGSFSLFELVVSIFWSLPSAFIRQITAWLRFSSTL